LRLLQRVARIEVELCADEPAALKQEATLIRSHRPKFNRAGVWQGKPHWLLWRSKPGVIEMSVADQKLEGWLAVAAFKWRAQRLRAVLARLLWLARRSGRIASMPCGWMHDQLPEIVAIEFSAEDNPMALAEMFTTGCAETFLQWLLPRVTMTDSMFEATTIAGDVEELTGLINTTIVAREAQKAKMVVGDGFEHSKA
jgi:hypothetical protein